MKAGISNIKKQSRREFLNYLLGVGIAGWIFTTLYTLYSFLKSPDIKKSNFNKIHLGNVNEFKKNDFRTFKLGKTPGILIHTEEGEFKALSTVCSHLQCTVQYKQEEKMFWCPCHNGKYSINGKNISGPPPVPLSPLNVTLYKNELFVSKV